MKISFFCSDICRIFGGYFLAATVFGGAAPAYSQAQYRVAVPNVAPWSFTDQAEHLGIHVELMRKIADLAKVSVEIVPIVYSRVPYGVKTGMVDLGIGNGGSKMDDAGRKIGRILITRVVVVGSRKTEISSINDLQGRVLGVIRSA